MATYKEPKHQIKIHVPEMPNAFTFRKNGKLRLDQQVKKFCLLNKCPGCFEVKVPFGRNVNPTKINYDAQQTGILIDTLKDQQKYKLFVPYPKGLELSIPSNPEAQFFCGVLSAKLAIIKYDIKKLLKNTKSVQKKMTKKNAEKQSQKLDDKNDNKNDDEDKSKNEWALIKQRKAKMLEKRNKRKQYRKKLKRKRKSALSDLNKRIAENNGNIEDNLEGPPTKKQKSNSNEMSINDQHDLIDGVVNKIESKEREQKQKDLQKDTDIKEYFQNRAERKKNKQVKKDEIRKKFMERKFAKKKANKMEQRSMKRTSKKRVTFQL